MSPQGNSFPKSASEQLPAPFHAAPSGDWSPGETNAESRIELEKFRAENRELQERLDLETMITSLSTHFINLNADRIDAGIQYALRILGQWSGAERISILQYGESDQLLNRTHVWITKGLEGVPPLPEQVDLRAMTWLRERMQGLLSIDVPNAGALPETAVAERASWKARGSQSMLAVPLMYRGAANGYLILETLSAEHRWKESHVSTLRVAGELFTNALERKKAESALREAKQKYVGIFENALEGIYQTTPEGRCLSANPALAVILGYDDPKQLMELLPLVDGVYASSGRRAEFITAVTRGGEVRGFESQVRRRNGEVIWISENARAVPGSDGKIHLFEGMVMDITQRKRMEERILHDALHDALTGLPNRVLFLERVARALDRATRKPDERCAVLLMDLDRFKMVNDSMGHTRGDLLLLELSRRLTRLLPAGATMARLGGDEFGFLLEEITGLEQAEVLAMRLQRETSLPMVLEGQEIYASGSIGIALGKTSYRTPGELLRDADTALHRAKGNGKGCHAVFDDSMHHKAVKLLRMETDMRKALERREFLLHYQPIVDIRTRQLTGFEALARWQHPTLGTLVPPSDFIPVAEDTGLILPLGKWVVEEAARQLRFWQEQFLSDPPLSMSVNISGRQFEDENLVSHIRETCKIAGIPPSRLKLEITESALMRNPDVAASVLHELRDNGFMLSLDDFGTGYSSLSYLHRFPFHVLKIDRSFVMRLETGNKEDEIIRVISAMADTLGMDVVAEGIETKDQLTHLMRHGVRYGQGYYFSRPLDIVAADKALRAPEGLWPETAIAA